MLSALFEEYPERHVKEVLDRIARLDSIETFIKGYVDSFVELTAGLLRERCDNLLANTKDENIRTSL